MINGIAQIISELSAIDAIASRHIERLERERGEIITTMNKAQSTFGDQESGQNLVIALSHVLNRIVIADSALYSLKSDIREYTQHIQK